MSLENDRNVITKPRDKGSSMVVLDRLNYLAEDEKTYHEKKKRKITLN